MDQHGPTHKTCCTVPQHWIISHIEYPPNKSLVLDQSHWIKTMIKRVFVKAINHHKPRWDGWKMGLGIIPGPPWLFFGRPVPRTLWASEQTNKSTFIKQLQQLGFFKMAGLVPLYDNINGENMGKWWQTMEWNELSIAILFSIKTITPEIRRKQRFHSPQTTSENHQTKLISEHYAASFLIMNNPFSMAFGDTGCAHGWSDWKVWFWCLQRSRFTMVYMYIATNGHQ